jgi:repressor LexA
MDKEVLRQVFAENLKRYMKRDDRNQTDIMRVTGASQSAVSDWLNAIKYPRMDKVQALADYFSINLSDLVEERKDGISQDECELLEAYRKLNPIIKEHILLSVKSAAKR